MPRPLRLLLLCVFLFVGSCAVTGRKSQPDGLRSTSWNGSRIAWENRGGGEDALVFVHGWAADRSIWDKQLDSLGPWRRIAVDLPGHGASDRPTIDYRVDAMVDALLALLDDAGVGHAVLVGHAEGALAARRFLDLYPGRVAGLVLVDAPLQSPFGSPGEGAAFLTPLAGAGWREWTARYVDGMLAPLHDAAERKHLRTVMLATESHVLLTSLRGTLEPELWRERPIGVPLLLLMAQSSPWRESTRALAERVAPGARCEVLDGVSHFLMLDDPERVDAFVRAFLIERATFARR